MVPLIHLEEPRLDLRLVVDRHQQRIHDGPILNHLVPGEVMIEVDTTIEVEDMIEVDMIEVDTTTEVEEEDITMIVDPMGEEAEDIVEVHHEEEHVEMNWDFMEI